MRDALDVVADDARCVCSEAYTSRNMKDPACNHDTLPYIETIRAELLRLDNDNDRLHKVACTQLRRAQKAEAELAALKARIAEAPFASVQRIPDSIGGIERTYTLLEEDAIIELPSLIGKTVRLLVEE